MGEERQEEGWQQRSLDWHLQHRDQRRGSPAGNSECLASHLSLHKQQNNSQFNLPSKLVGLESLYYL